MADTPLPCLDAFVGRLPHGLDSYPDCTSRASAYRQMLDAHPGRKLRAAKLPAPLQALVDDPVPVSLFIPEVHHIGLAVAFAELEFDSVEESTEWWYRQSIGLFGSKMYRRLFHALGPTNFLRLGALRFRHFRKGRTRVELKAQDQGCVVDLYCAPHLYAQESSARAMGSAFRAAGFNAGAKDPQAAVEHISPEHLRYTLTWRE